MGKFHVHPLAKDDLLRLGVLYPGPIFKLTALMKQMEADRRKFAELWVHGRGKVIRIDDLHVFRWGTAQEAGLPLWRFKDLGLEREGHLFRVFYCKANKSGTEAHILGVIRKVLPPDLTDFDYDDLDSPAAARILRAYRSLTERPDS
jgi:hypothetical protein